MTFNMDQVLMTLVPFFMVLVGFLVYASFTKNVRNAKQNRTWTKAEPEVGPESVSQSKTEQQPKPSAAPIQGFTAFDAARSADDGIWPSRADFHEGEDPCHDDMEPIVASAPEPAQPASRLSTDDLVKGFVTGEILNRKRR